MTIFDFANELNGRNYGDEITPQEKERAKENGFVVVYGYSDDCAELRGAINDEIDCFDGGRIFDSKGYFINAVWDNGEYIWSYETNIPHATFDIYEDGEKYCKGIVFALNFKPKMTNYERIKAMSVEEMAEFLEEVHFTCRICLNNINNGGKGCARGCINGFRKYLESEVNDNEDND